VAQGNPKCLKRIVSVHRPPPDETCPLAHTLWPSALFQKNVAYAMSASVHSNQARQRTGADNAITINVWLAAGSLANTILPSAPTPMGGYAMSASVSSSEEILPLDAIIVITINACHVVQI